MGVDTSRDDDLRVPYVKVITKLGIVIKKTNDIMNMAAFLLTAFIKISNAPFLSPTCILLTNYSMVSKISLSLFLSLPLSVAHSRQLRTLSLSIYLSFFLSISISLSPITKKSAFEMCNRLPVSLY